MGEGSILKGRMARGTIWLPSKKINLDFACQVIYADTSREREYVLQGMVLNIFERCGLFPSPRRRQKEEPSWVPCLARLIWRWCSWSGWELMASTFMRGACLLWLCKRPPSWQCVLSSYLGLPSVLLVHRAPVRAFITTQTVSRVRQLQHTRSDQGYWLLVILSYTPEIACILIGLSLIRMSEWA